MYRTLQKYFPAAHRQGIDGLGASLLAAASLSICPDAQAAATPKQAIDPYTIPHEVVSVPLTMLSGVFCNRAGS